MSIRVGEAFLAIHLDLSLCPETKALLKNRGMLDTGGDDGVCADAVWACSESTREKT